MVICKYFLQGNCRYGATCRNEHPRNTGFGGQNRFAPLQNAGVRPGAGNDARRDNPNWNINVADIQNDLTGGKNRPNWILSTYGPGRGPPASLLEGNEYSPEEVRVRFYELAENGKQAEADQEAIALWNKADQSMRDIASHADNVLKFMEDADRKHPNRYDFCKMDGSKTRDQVEKETQAQAQPSNQPVSTFGTGSGFTQISSGSNPFSKPSSATFGQASAPSAFGSSTFGQASTPAFGQTGFGGAAGQTGSTGTLGQSSAFGKPSFGSTGFGQPAFGQPAQSSSGFGQTSEPASNIGQPGFGSAGFGQAAPKNPFAAPTAASGFGQASSSFGQPTQPSSAFGQPSQSNVGFGQPSQPYSAFGQPSQPTSAFGKPSLSPSAFGQASNQVASAFGQPTQPSGFGKPAFGQATQVSSSFGQPSQPTSSLFGHPSQPGISTFGSPTPSTAFGPSSTTPAFGSTSAPNNTFGSNATFGSNPFAAKSNVAELNDQAMEATTSMEDRPPTRNDQFSNPSSGFGSANAPVFEQKEFTPNPPAKLNVTTSTTPHPLTDRPPKPVHYTQTLPLQPNQTNMSKELVSYRGRRVRYIDGGPCYERPDGNGWEKIWFPDGGSTSDVLVLNKADKLEDLQASESQYTDVIKDAYKILFEEGRFKDGKIPLVPPMHEWCVYDF